ncbi:hypothetical protein E2C01_048695 [Portunus trituberculatus]|uniref:Uncharacterized protein n=1 Tax=Portunus trituberculatus TaxID=210409 RepID=A0A5B7G3R8_PORTR|nr:hypothetical protein [Portunus trituberculatus]
MILGPYHKGAGGRALHHTAGFSLRERDVVFQRGAAQQVEWPVQFTRDTSGLPTHACPRGPSPRQHTDRWARSNVILGLRPLTHAHRSFLHTPTGNRYALTTHSTHQHHYNTALYYLDCYCSILFVAARSFSQFCSN